jgi:hypothetical protein
MYPQSEPEILSADRTTTTAPAPTTRSRRTNGSSLFVAGDGRGAWARRWRDLVALYADDLGGHDVLSAFQAGLVETAATLRCELEKLEGRLSLGGEVDLDQFGRLTGHYRRVCETLGIERRKRDLIPSLNEYLTSKSRGAP